jgi:hypothetical protein
MYKDSEAADVMSQSHEDAADDYSLAKHSHMKYEIRETPGLCKQAIKQASSVASAPLPMPLFSFNAPFPTVPLLCFVFL